MQIVDDAFSVPPPALRFFRASTAFFQTTLSPEREYSISKMNLYTSSAPHLPENVPRNEADEGSLRQRTHLQPLASIGEGPMHQIE